MLFKGVLITNASGRIDDAVASRNRGGAYFRALGNPNPNPASDAQTQARAAAAAVYSTWQSMTDAQRRRWYDYSGDTKRTGRAGGRRSVGGFQEFSRANLPRAYVLAMGLWGPSQVIEPPADATPPADGFQSAAFAGSTKIALNFDPLRPWVNDSESLALVFLSTPQSLTRYSVRSGFRLVGVVEPEQSYGDFASGEDYTGAACFVRIRVTFSDGRLSTPRIVRVV